MRSYITAFGSINSAGKLTVKAGNVSTAEFKHTVLVYDYNIHKFCA